MKLEPLFTVKDNKLYKIEDNSPVDISSLLFEEISWATVELQDEAYNEEFLASLRDKYKQYEESGKFVVLVPVIDRPFETPEQLELFINAFNHTARRIKDCVSVVGFELPEQLTQKGFEAGTPASDFMETLAIKHAQYIYFSKAENSPNNFVVKL